VSGGPYSYDRIRAGMEAALACPHYVEFPCPDCGEGELLDRVADRLETTVAAHHNRYSPKAISDD
jgi:hypothetical protein